MKLMKETASLVNFMLNNPKFHKPEVGEDVTELLWTDRSAWRVTAVDPDGKGCTITEYNAKWIGKGYGDETYQYDDENGNPLLGDRTMHIRYKYKAWRVVSDYCGMKTSSRGWKINLAWGIRDEYRDPSF